MLSTTLLLLAAVAFAAAAGMALLRYVLVPNIPKYKPLIEARASKLLGTPLTIGELKVSWSEWSPVIDAEQVQVRNHEGELALKLAQVHTQISWRSLLDGAIVFERLELAGPELVIKRLANGKLQIAGLDVDPFAKSDDDSLNRWLVEQRRISIHGGVLHWIDQLRDAPQATLRQANLELVNAGLQHALKLSGELITAGERYNSPATLEARADFSHPVTLGFGGNKADVTLWAGQIYAAMSHASLSEIRRYADIPFAIERGEGSVRAWLELDKGVVTQATADVALDKVKAQLAKDAPWLDLEKLSGRLLAKPQALQEGGLDIGAQGLTWQVAGRKAVEPADIALQADSIKDEDKGKGRFTATSLNLGELQQLARYVRLPAGINKALERQAPQGILRDIQASWRGTAEAPKEYEFKSRFTDLALSAVAAKPATGPQLQSPELNPGTPGFKTVSGTLRFTQAEGEAQLAMKDGSVQLPGIMDPETIVLDTLKAQVNWKRESAAVNDGKTALTVPVLRVDIVVPEIANTHAAGHAKVSWRQDPAEVLALQKAAASKMPLANFLSHSLPGTLDLQGVINRADAKAVWRYLPVSISTGVKNYLQSAIVQGAARNIQVQIRGDLYHFPFARDPIDKDKAILAAKPELAMDWRGLAARPDEIFHISAEVNDAILDYVPASTGADGHTTPGWPAIKGLSGELIFDGPSMVIRDARGSLNPDDESPAITLSRVKGRIADMRQRPKLELEGSTQGTLTDYLGFVRKTPVNLWTGKVLDQAKASGNAQLDLKLGLPFAEMKNSTVEGKLLLDGNELQIAPAIPRFSAATGQVQFSEKGFAVKPMKAQFLGGEASIEGGTQEDRTTAFTATGIVTAQALKAEASLGILSLIASRATGQSPYEAKVLIRTGQPEITVTAPLTGMALDFPAPLGKAADTALPVKYSTQILGAIDKTAGNPDGLRDQLDLSIGSNIAIQYERQLRKTESGVEAKVLRGGIGVNNPALMPQEGVFANIAMPRFDADAWGAALRHLPGNGSAAVTPLADASAAAGGPVTAAEEPLSTSEMLQNPYIPSIVALQVDELMAGKKPWMKIVAGATFREGQWQANVDSTSFSGFLAWRAGTSVGSLGKVTARLGRLSVPKDNRDFEQLLDEPAEQLPAIDLVAQEFELGGKNLGRLELEAVNIAGRTREWSLNRLVIANPESTLTANGNWLPVVGTANGGPSLKAALGPSKRVVMNFNLDVKDSGALLTRFGIPKTVKDGAGTIEGKLSWTGAPTSLDFPTLAGQISMKMQKGQFLKQDPGIARLLGVLSLQTLPRRITLDFRDVFSEGFVFDEVTADATVERGIARTNNFRMKGTQANVLMEGNADLARETQNLFVVVEPDINLGTASLAYAIINPAVGLTTFLLQWLARNQVNKALAFEYRVTGSWVNPKVEKVDTQIKARGDDSIRPPAQKPQAATSETVTP